MKKTLISIIAVLCTGTILFAACSAQSAPAGAPASTAESEPAGDLTPEPEPEPEPLSRFDEAVAQYEQENGLALAAASGEEKDAFFAGLYALEYSRDAAEADKAETSEANRALLEEYIAYVDSVEAGHEPCEFDAAVSAFLSANPEVDLEAYPVPLFQDIFDQGLSLPYIEMIETTGCDSPYAPLFIGWYKGTIEFEDPNAPHFHRATPEEIEEQNRLVEEWTRQMEEEAAEAERNAGNNHGRGNNF